MRFGALRAELEHARVHEDPNPETIRTMEASASEHARAPLAGGEERRAPIARRARTGARLRIRDHHVIVHALLMLNAAGGQKAALGFL